MEESAISSISSSVIKQEQEVSSLSLVIKGVHLPILHIGMVGTVADDEIMVLPLNLEGVTGPGTDIDGEGRLRELVGSYSLYMTSSLRTS